ncbi:hypothetical protein ES703_11505 [subsurface metagenome]
MKIALIGCGTVGRGLLELINEKQLILTQKYNLDPIVSAISDPVVGSVYNEGGLDLNKILSLLETDNNIKNYSNGITGWDSLKTIKESNADVIVEATPTNLETGEPGLTHIRTALKSGKDVATTNKGPIALAYHELKALTLNNRCELRFEGTVLAGTPALNLALLTLAGIEIKEVRGIVNGTTNYILTRMESGMSYDEALREAQEKGYAEAKPDADVKGWDALAKIIIIANVLMGGNLKVVDVEREGIDGISKEDVEKALGNNKHWKLIARAWRGDGEIKASVSPKELSEDDPLARIMGVTNAINFTTDVLREVTISGPGAGKRETGFALLSDLIDIYRFKEG